MTRKRFQGLARELMNRILKSGDALGHSYRCIRDWRLANTEFKSHQECWDSLKPIREQYGM